MEIEKEKKGEKKGGGGSWERRGGGLFDRKAKRKKGYGFLFSFLSLSFCF